jgi:hypothetical protein
MECVNFMPFCVPYCGLLPVYTTYFDCIISINICKSQENSDPVKYKGVLDFSLQFYWY